MSAADKNDTMKTSKQTVSCADFQDQLPDLFESGADLRQQEHLQTCAQCAALVRDLEYIAQQAKLLLPIHDPSPAVWDNIQTTLATQGNQKNGSNPK
jgi:ubiquitin